MTNETKTRGASFNDYLMHALRVALTNKGHTATSASKLMPSMTQQQLSDYLNGVHVMNPEKFHAAAVAIGEDPAQIFKDATLAFERGDQLPKKRERRKRSSKTSRDGSGTSGRMVAFTPSLAVGA